MNYKNYQAIKKFDTLEAYLHHFSQTSMKNEIPGLLSFFFNVSRNCSIVMIFFARSVLIFANSAEEKGLLGSYFYVENPVFPLNKTIACLNVDMVGRVDKNHPNDSNYVYLIGSDKLSTDLHNTSEKANEKYVKMELDYRYNEPGDPNRFYYRSDHYNFAKNNIPVIFYFNGIHEDYHKTTDTIEKIDFDKIQKITRLIFLTAWEIVNRDQRIVVDRDQN